MTATFGCLIGVSTATEPPFNRKITCGQQQEDTRKVWLRRSPYRLNCVDAAYGRLAQRNHLRRQLLLHRWKVNRRSVVALALTVRICNHQSSPGSVRRAVNNRGRSVLLREYTCIAELVEACGMAALGGSVRSYPRRRRPCCWTGAAPRYPGREPPCRRPWPPPAPPRTRLCSDRRGRSPACKSWSRQCSWSESR